MRICVTGLRGLPGVQGGVETHCEMLLPRVAALLEGCEITVLARAPYIAPEVREHRGLRIVPLWALKQKHLEAITHAIASVIIARWRLRPDVLHVHGIGPALVTPLARLLGMRVIVTHHGADYAREKWGPIARLALRLGEVFAIRFADCVIVVSPSAARALRARHEDRADRIVCVPNGAPDQAVGGGEVTLRRLGLRAGGFILGVGRLVPEKGFHDLIEARRLAKDPRPLVIAGDADHADGYARRLRAQAGEGVIFAGRLNRAELQTLYESCAVFVLPSHHEGLAIAALEALTAGAPCLLSDIAANRDLGLPEGFYFPVANAEALRERLVRPAARLEPGSDALAPFDWSRIAAETARIYRAAIG